MRSPSKLVRALLIMLSPSILNQRLQISTPERFQFLKSFLNYFYAS